MSSTSPLKPGDHLYLIDGSGYIFRAYHALPPLTRKSDGLPVGAVQGFCNMLWKLLKETKAGEKPTHLAVIFDHSSKSFRNDIYPQYKAQRPEPPADLRPQFGLIRQATRAFNVACVEQANYEADDLIATYARQAVEAGATCRIVSSDKDLMQLIRPGVALYDTMKDREVGEPEVLEKFGVTPDKVVDIQALAGDSVDNVPGVPGIGVKTAAQLITEYGDLETLLARAPEIKQQKRRENLIEFAEQARISKKLVVLDDHVPVEHDVSGFAVDNPKASQLIGFTKALEFTSFTKKVAGELDADSTAIEPIPVEVKFWPPEGGEGVPLPPPRFAAKKAEPAAEAQAATADVPPSSADAALLAIPVTHADYETVTTLASLEAWCAAAYEKGYLALDTETDSLDSMRANLVGVSLATAPGRACYIPLQHKASGGGLFGGELVEGQVPLDQAIAVLKRVLEDPSILKIGQNLKYDIEVLKRHGIAVAPIDDTMLISYVLESGDVGHGMDELSLRHLNHKCIAFKDVAGSGKSMITFDRVPVADATRYAAEDADITLRLWLLLKPRLAAQGKLAVYETLERPLIAVLAAMEMEGILIDPELLRRLSNDLATACAGIETHVYELAGERFNIGSPKQLGDILFGRMGLPGGRKTATGAWSTDSDALEDLAGQGIELARRVLDWRQLSKLRSTYTDALPNYINPETKRVHTSYSLAATSTGRLASTDPNLQNIPVRTEEGRKIRSAFIAPEGSKLVSADYSQIELRVVAHVADIAQLKKAFAEGQDIHAMTASEMFNVPVEGMDPMVRRRAKAINFGIIYGISAFGLANQLGIGREEAGEYIRTYFKRFPGIRDYMEATKQEARDKGYVETIFGRRMHFPRIKSPNPSERAFLERAAINAPIQGAAADIIRRAMIRMPDALSEAGLSARMLLQVHDELIFECVDAEAETTMAVVKKIMVSAPDPVVKLSVPLQVDARAAQNWEAAH
ncbi:DNA polymerase I [Aestuariivirga litoralis]|uniref:DNA polymerase I n=1 Tax=Aestuariivirga litoralis TaxID=2650924 RepID=A0A2W2AS56_9HYPH|nr:DNA polymerase I [Aestuariivirga litoralis]PZF76472.1 DNA polymerase I [Aestuariivirga litoralis]